MLKLAEPNIEPADLDKMNEALLAGRIDPGPACEEVAERLAEMWRVPRSWVLLTSSCTAAIGLAAQIIGGVFTAPIMTWPGSYCSVPKKEFCDVHENGCMLIDDLYKRPSIFVHMWGASCPTLGTTDTGMLPTIYDRAQDVFGGIPFDQFAPSPWAVCFSFGPIKELTSMRGGALVMPGADSFRYLTQCETVGRRYYHKDHLRGGNYTMTEPGAILLREQLKREFNYAAVQALETPSHKRHHILRRYEELFHDCEEVELVTKAGMHSGHLAVIKVQIEYRDRLQRYLQVRGIETSVHYYYPRDLLHSTFPTASLLGGTVLSIPCHHKMKPFNDTAIVAEHIKSGILAIQRGNA